MNAEQFSEYRHEAVHRLMRLNEGCEHQFRISSWPRWDYDLEDATLTFSQDGIPQVIATIQVVGTTSKVDGSWLWGWANRDLPANVTEAVRKVRIFGESENLPVLVDERAPDDEYLGWEVTAITARILESKGAYRCPGNNGFVYLVYTDLAFADKTHPTPAKNQIECTTHGMGYQTYVCQHLVAKPAQEWFSESTDENNQWPDAWCSACDSVFQEEGEWNDRNQAKLKIKLLCHYCYEQLRAQALPAIGS